MDDFETLRNVLYRSNVIPFDAIDGIAQSVIDYGFSRRIGLFDGLIEDAIQEELAARCFDNES